MCDSRQIFLGSMILFKTIQIILKKSNMSIIQYFYKIVFHASKCLIFLNLNNSDKILSVILINSDS